MDIKGKLSEIIKHKSKDTTECAKVLGSTSRVDNLASFYSKNAEILHLITVNGIVEWTADNTFNRDELDAFKQGIMYVGEFMDKCSVERRTREAIKQQEA